MGEYFAEPKSSGGKIKVELDLTNYARKEDLKKAASVDTSNFPKKAGLANLKYNVDKLNIDNFKNVLTNLSNLKNKIDKSDVYKLVYFPVDLSKLSNVVRYDVKKDVYSAKVKNVENKMPDVTGIPSITNLATTAALNAKISEVENKIPNITNLATTTALPAVESKIPNVSNLVKKLTITQILMKLKIKLLLIMIMINILLLKNLIS